MFVSLIEFIRSKLLFLFVHVSGIAEHRAGWMCELRKSEWVAAKELWRRAHMRRAEQILLALLTLPTRELQLSCFQLTMIYTI